MAIKLGGLTIIHGQAAIIVPEVADIGSRVANNLEKVTNIISSFIVIRPDQTK